MVFTAKSPDQILSEGGTSSWALGPKSLRECEYVICTRNTDPEKVSSFGARSGVAHGSAFLVGRFAGLEHTGDRNGRKRYRVLFSAYAEIDCADFWDGSRVPTRYISIADAEERGVSLADLDFTDMQVSDSDSQSACGEEVGRNPDSLTVEQAKAGLAAKFGVSVDQIEIVIRT